MGGRFWRAAGMVLCAAALTLGCSSKSMVQKKQPGDPLLNTASSTTNRKTIVGASGGGGSGEPVASYQRPEWSPAPVPPRRDSAVAARQP